MNNENSRGLNPWVLTDSWKTDERPPQDPKDNGEKKEDKKEENGKKGSSPSKSKK